MIKLMIALTLSLREVTAESFHEYNTQPSVVYPYLTFDVSGEAISRNVEGIYLDVDVFDNTGSYDRLFELETALKAHFRDYRKMTDDLYIRCDYLRSNPVPTGDQNIKRRNIQFYVNTDWRTH